jgi:hypothetical protein
MRNETICASAPHSTHDLSPWPQGFGDRFPEHLPPRDPHGMHALRQRWLMVGSPPFRDTCSPTRRVDVKLGFGVMARSAPGRVSLGPQRDQLPESPSSHIASPYRSFGPDAGLILRTRCTFVANLVYTISAKARQGFCRPVDSFLPLQGDAQLGRRGSPALRGDTNPAPRFRRRRRIPRPYYGLVAGRPTPISSWKIRPAPSGFGLARSPTPSIIFFTPLSLTPPALN